MIYIVGIGPGNRKQMTEEAIKAIEKVTHIVGYKTYIKLIQPLIQDKIVVQNGMRGEVERCAEAVDLSLKGLDVAVISSGDAGVYGMAGLIYEIALQKMPVDDVKKMIKVIPGVTASIAGAAHLGAPLMHDFCHISLSDLLTPYERIMKRVKHAAQGDFVICFYNPKSHGRPHHIEDALKIIEENTEGNRWVAVISDVGREGMRQAIYPLKAVDFHAIHMTSMVIVGNSQTFEKEGLLITPRGYAL